MTPAVGPQTLAAHVEVIQVEHCFGEAEELSKQIGMLQALVPGVLVDVSQRENLIEELKYGNHPGVRDHVEVMAEAVVAGGVTGRALVFSAKFVQEIRSIHFSSLSVVE